MKKDRKVVYHIGDKVKIIKPDIFLRCGYPMGLEDAKEKLVTPRQKELIVELIDGRHNNKLHYYHKIEDCAIYQKILKDIAYMKLVSAGFGGPIRSIHTTSRFELQDKIANVIGKQVVKTGYYNTGYTSGWEYPEENPPYLGDMKSHTILELEVRHERDGKFCTYNPIKIEECNVIKYIPQELRESTLGEICESGSLNQEISKTGV